MRHLFPILLLVTTAAAPAAAASYELALGYAAPTSDALDSAYKGGGALDLRVPLRGTDREYLTWDVGGQLYGADRSPSGLDLRGVRTLITEHLRVPGTGERLQVFAGVGLQLLWTEKPEPLTAVGAPEPVPGTVITPASDPFDGAGPAATAGLGLTVLGDTADGVQLQGAWTVARMEGVSQSYGVLGVAWLFGD